MEDGWLDLAGVFLRLPIFLARRVLLLLCCCFAPAAAALFVGIGLSDANLNRYVAALYLRLAGRALRAASLRSRDVICLYFACAAGRA